MSSKPEKAQNRNRLVQIWKGLFIAPLFYIVVAFLAALYFAGNAVASFYVAAEIGLIILLVMLVADFLLLFRYSRTLRASRLLPNRFSNGDQNSVSIYVESYLPYPISLTVLEELPPQLQIRDTRYDLQLGAGEQTEIHYSLRPTRRGEYRFGSLNLFISNQIGLLQRRIQFPAEASIAVYPSFIQMRKYELMAISNRLTEAGIKKIRRVGHTMEFDQIREYVKGDDYRTVNWKATARRRALMVNHYQDEKAQQVYSIIDKGRVMKMPFEEMTLLDYAINASLVISNIAIRKQDKAGIITYSNSIDQVLNADRNGGQIAKILEVLYRQETDFLESDMETLYATVLKKLKQRSLLLLYTNFESLSGMRRQLRYLRGMARKHLLVVVFFENTELQGLQNSTASSAEDIYVRTIADQFKFEKRQIVRELQRHGIYSILTTPQMLSVNTINRYLELKARGLI